MRLFLDSSSLAKRYILEQGSDGVDRLCADAAMLGVSIICIPEIISALNRRVRERRLSAFDYAAARERLLADLEDAEIVQLTPAVISRSTVILENNPVRAMDALHVACAVEWGAELFASSDKAQVEAARKAHVACRLV